MPRPCEDRDLGWRHSRADGGSGRHRRRLRVDWRVDALGASGRHQPRDRTRVIVSLPAPGQLPDDISAALSHAAARLQSIGSQILWYDALPSTNDVATLLAERGADEGVVVLADMQTAGRGRFGRSWASPPGAGIYASIVFRPDAAAARLLTIAAGVAVADGIL